MTKKIEIFEVQDGFVSPISETETANCSYGDLLFIFDETDVWIRHWGDSPGDDDRFVKPVYSAEFVRLNPIIFRKKYD